VRVALLSCLLSGIVLLLFALYTGHAVRQASRDRLDRELRALALRHLNEGRLDWEALEQSLAYWFPGVPDPRVIAAVQAEDTVARRSQGWPEDLLLDQIHAPQPRNSGGEAGNVPPPVLLSNARAQGAVWRMAAAAAPDQVVYVGVDLNAYGVHQRQFIQGLVGALLIGLALIAAGSYLIADRALRPVERLTRTARELTAQGLDARLPVDSREAELAELTNVFNDMLNRLERSFGQATRFSADAAHELKTPLAILQGLLEEGVQGSEPESEEQRRYSRLLDQVQRLKAILQKLFLLARADAGDLTIHRTRIDFTALVRDACDDTEVLAPHLKFYPELEEGLFVEGDPHLLRQAVQNLLTNAVKHNRPEGKIGVRLQPRKGQVSLKVVNTGSAIPEEMRDMIFERFYRVDKSRHRESGGSGLGLSLAREIARAHGGALRLERGEADHVTFRLVLPA
jgi:heavy metal sensor kinase